MHVRNIEPVAISSPDFVEDLIPLFGRDAIYEQTCSRNSLASAFTLRSRVVQVCAWSLKHQYLRSIVRKCVAANIFNKRCLFPILNRVDAQRCSAIRLATVITCAPDRIKQVTSLRTQVPVIVSAQWDPCDAY